MSSAVRGNIKMAIASVRSTRWRSFLTMLGIIIGVVSVVTVVSIGQGIKHQVSQQINQLGHDLITIRPGQLVQRGSDGAIDNVNLFAGPNGVGMLSQKDLENIQKTPGIRQAVPLGLVSGEVSPDGQHASVQPLVLATTADLQGIINQPLAYGGFFDQDTSEQPNVAVIGSNVAKSLYKQRAPLGHSFDLLGQTFVIRGVFNQFDTTPLSLNTDFNDAIFIPYSSAQVLTQNNTPLYEILAKPTESKRLGEAVNTVSHTLSTTHQSQQKFTVLRQDESLGVTNNILNLLTKLIAGIAAVSLLVGGIGIMDVMLVSVAERMHEIGIRKALGASNKQILVQFLVESSVLSLTGGVIGVVVSLVVAFLLNSFTSLTPIVTWQVVVVATLVSLLVGIVFGSAPALKAARKDPIDALRNE